MQKIPYLPATVVWVVLACQPAQCKERESPPVSTVGVGALLAGFYDNASQVTQGQSKATPQNPAPPHVTVTVEPTQQPDWELWRVHMDVDPAVAQSAGSATSLDAVWAMNIAKRAYDKSWQLIPYTLRPSVDAATVRASAFDETQWLTLEACMLRGAFSNARIVAQVAGDEMCVAEGMGLGGKRAFLPSGIEREGDSLQVQLMYLGVPLRVDARRVKTTSDAGHGASRGFICRSTMHG